MLRWFLRRIKRFVLLLVVLLLLLPLALWSMASTQGGSRWLINTTFKLLPLQISVEQVDGALVDAVTLQGIRFTAAPHSGAIARAHLRWQPAELLRRRLHLNEIMVDGLDLAIGKTQGGSETATLAAPPLEIALDDARVTNSSVTLEGKRYAIESAELSAHTVQQRLVVESLRVAAAPLQQASLAGEITLTKPYPLEFSLQWQAQHVQSGVLRGEGRLRGDFDALDFEHRLLTPLNLSTTAKIIPAEKPEIALQGEWRQLSWPLVGEAQLQSPRGSFSLSGTPAEFRMRLDAPVTGAGIPESEISLNASGNSTAIKLAPLQISLLNGQLNASGMVSWEQSPAWDLQITASNLQPQQQWPDYPGAISGTAALHGEMSRQGLLLAIDLEELFGTLRDRDVNGSGKARWAAGRLSVDHLLLNSGDNQVKLNGSMEQQLDFDFAVNAPDLQLLWPTLGGRLQAQGTLLGGLDAPRVEMHGSGEQLRLGQNRIAALTADIHWDPADADASSTLVELQGIDAAGRTFSNMVLKGPGNLARHQLQFKAAGSTAALDMQFNGGYAQQQWNGELQQGALQIDGAGVWKLSNAVEITAGAERVAIGQHCWRQQEASLCANAAWQAGADIDAAGELKRLPLALLQPLLPAEDKLAGELSGHFEANGPLLSPTVEAGLELPGARLVSPQTGATPNIELRNGKASATMQSNILEVSTNFDVRADEKGVWGETQGELQVDFSRQDQPIKGSVSLKYPDMSPLLARTPRIATAGGRLDIQARLGGTLAAPVIQGEAALKDGAFTLPDLNLDVKQITLLARADQNGQLQLNGEANTGRGKLHLDGKASLQAREGFPFEIRLQGKDVLVSQIPEAEVVVSPDLTLAGGNSTLNLSGEVDIPVARIKLHDVPPTAVDVSEDTVIIRDGKRLRAQENDGVVMALNSSIEITLGENVSFEGFGLTTDIKGELHLGSEAQRPVVGQGQLSMVDGTFLSYGQNLSIERGNFLFDGPVDNPRVDIRAFRPRSFDGVRAGVAITGNLRSLETRVFTEPPKSETEALTYLLGGSSKFGESSVAFGRYLTPRLYVGYLVGLFDSSSVVLMRYRLNNRLAIQTTSGDQQSVDLFYHIERDSLFRKSSGKKQE
jgi:translocation and assembly module TamB